MRGAANLLAALVLAGCSAAAPTTLPTSSVGPTPALTAAPSATVASSVAPSAAPSATVASSVGPSPAPTIGPLVEAALPADVADQLQSVLDGYVESALAPSLSATVIVPGVGIWSGASGLADIDEDVSATPDTVYGVASITKTFVAALILRLVEDGYLDLDDPAADHLGPIAAAKSNGATVRQLLGMRSGIDNYFARDVIWGSRPWSVADILDLVGEPYFTAGERFDYSNTNYLILGLIAEVVTGAPLGELLHEYLINPNDLTHTYYGATETAPEPLARGYVGSPDSLQHFYDGSGHLPNANFATALLGAGAMASTASDVSRWIYWLYGGDVLSAESLDEMLDFSASIEYGLGVNRSTFSGTGQVIGHRGEIPGFTSGAFMARDSGIVVVILSNADAFDIDVALNAMFTVALESAAQR